jgi:NTP pyrophosphatase (non-canonical NTP hydrolase)
VSDKFSAHRAAREIQGTFALVLTEIRRAVEKHGYSRTPLSRDPADVAKKLAVLLEEVGEVAHALNYDSADTDNLKDELVQVATMALAWRASLS